jgi:hypothetical protein
MPRKGAIDNTRAEFSLFEAWLSNKKKCKLPKMEGKWHNLEKEGNGSKKQYVSGKILKNPVFLHVLVHSLLG